MSSEKHGMRNVLIVAASKWAYHCYHRYSAYICQANRSFRSDIDRIGYYADGAIQPDLPTVLDRRGCIDVSSWNARALRSSGDRRDEAFANVVEQLLNDGREPGEAQVFLLSSPSDSRTARLPHPITNTERSGAGRVRAWAQGHRYVPESALFSVPGTTSELAVRIDGDDSRLD